jgi:hypothetical protein
MGECCRRFSDGLYRALQGFGDAAADRDAEMPEHEAVERKFEHKVREPERRQQRTAEHVVLAVERRRSGARRDRRRGKGAARIPAPLPATPAVFTIAPPNQPAQPRNFLLTQIYVRTAQGWRLATILPFPVP